MRRIYHADQWDRIVQSFPAYDFKQGFAWGELRARQGWSPSRVAVFDDGECVAACAVLCRPIAGVGSVLYAPRGPLFAPGANAAVTRLLDALGAVAARNRGVFVRLSPGIRLDDDRMAAVLADPRLLAIDEPWTTWNTPRYVQVLDLRRDEPTLFRGVRRRMREYILAAPRKGLVIEATDRDDDIAAFHGLMQNLGRQKGFPVRELDYYRQLVHGYRAIGSVIMLVARIGDVVVGGLVGVRFGRRAYLLYTSVRSNAAEAVKHHVAPAISWEFVRRARAAGCELADFGGSGVGIPPRPTDAGYGVYHFKAGLGCTLETFVPFRDLVLRPALYRLGRAGESRVLPRLWTIVARAPRAWPWRVLGAAA